ncbi:hypothetical protein ACFVAE_01040 [Microbacterium sp. NPDC057659]|uniref:hypothetical protein n=1 Tax=Microbacterium sp. NPDC057659 TaxID=3346198 RepID=UPI0036702DBB
MAFAVRRAGQHAGRLTLVGLVVALVVAGIGGLDAVAERMLQDGAARMMTDAEPDARTVRLVADEASDAAKQDAAVRDAIAAAFAGSDIVVARQATADVRAASRADRFDIGLLDDERVPVLATLAEGAWPKASGQVALSAAAADRAHLGVGDVIVLSDPSVLNGVATELRVVGTWTPRDASDPAWHGDPSVVSGENDDVIGPALVSAGALSELPDPPQVTWEIAPADADLAAIPGLQSGVRALQDVPEVVDPEGRHNMDVVGSLGATLQRQALAVAGTRGLLVAPLLIIALLGALVLGVVLFTLSAAREEEVALLRARGASGRRLALGAAAESALLASAGALLALGGLAVFGSVTTTLALVALGAVVFPAVVAVLFTLRVAGGADGAHPARSDAGLRTLPALILPALVAVAFAALATWQLFSGGSVLRPDGSTDALAATAPALLVIAACALVPVLAAPLAALLERLLRRTSGIAPILPLRQIARRIGGTAVAILCLALAAASVALAVAAPAVASAAEQRALDAALGGDVRMIAEGGVDVTADEAGAWKGVTSAADILRTPLAVGTDAVDLLAGPADALGLAGPIDDGSGDIVGAEITKSLADRLGAHIGTVFTAQVRFAAQPVSIRVTTIVDSLPGLGTDWGVATEPAMLTAAGVELAPDELWLNSDDPATTAERLRAHATHPVRILTAAQVSSAPVTAVAPAVLTAGALIAAVLGVFGFVAASSAMSRSRRDEPMVLRALGLRRSKQRALRAGETTGVAVYAVIAGAAMGAAVAVTVLPVILGAGS